MSQNPKYDLGQVLGLILGREKCLLNCTPGFLQIHGGDVTNEAYLLTLGGTQWTAMASMAEVRRGLACGVVRNWATDKEEVVAAAGYKP